MLVLDRVYKFILGYIISFIKDWFMNIVFPDAGSLGSDLDLSLFHNLGNFIKWENTPEKELEDRIRNADVIITNRIILDEEQLKAAKKLKLIALTATGFNNVNREYCQKNRIALANVASYSTDSVAQHTFTILLYLLEHSRYYDDYIRREAYLEDQSFANVSRPWNEINGKNWGIIGLGSIGRKVASIAEAFGARVFYYSTSGVERPEKWKRLSLEDLLRTSDILSIHAPLNGQTENLISSGQFNIMKKNAILLNLGRGAIVNEEALIEALKDRKIAAAGLDVLCSEPPLQGSPLLNFVQEDRLFITPHNAWGSLESRMRLVKEVYKNITAFNNGIERNRIV